MPPFSLPSPHMCFADAPSVSIVLPDEASLWACGTLYACFPDRIAFQSAHYRVTLTGEELVLKAMSASEVYIRGRRITGVRCERLENGVPAEPTPAGDGAEGGE